MADVEVWKDVVGYEGHYQVSNLGRVKSLPRVVVNKIRRVVKEAFIKVNKSSVVLSVSGRQKTCYVYRLVLEAFVGPCPIGMVACHYPDRSRDNNNLSNLRWDTHSGNEEDKKKHGTQVKGESVCTAKLKESDVREIKQMLISGHPQRYIAKIYGVGLSAINSISLGRRWKHVQ